MRDNSRVRLIAALLAAAAAIGCSNDERDPNDPGGGGAGSTVTIGPSGGSVAATLEDGSTMSITIPAGALADPIDITLEPRKIANGELTAFTISPAGIRLAHPLTLEITMDDGEKLSATSVVTFEQNGLRVPVKSTPNLSAGSITATLDVLGVPEVDAAPVPGPRAISRFVAGGGSGSGSLQNTTPSQLSQDALAALDNLETVGTVVSGLTVQLIMDAWFTIDPSPQTNPDFNLAVSRWRVAVCADLQFATNVVNSFNFSSDYRGLERVFSDMVGWAQAVTTMTGTLAGVGETGCTGGLPDPQATVDAKLAELIPAINTDLTGFALLPAPRDSSFHVDRLSPLLDLSVSMSLDGFDSAASVLKALLPPQANRLRDAGYADCLAHNKQSIQGRLIRLEAQQGVFTAVSDYDARDLEDDIELCGMQVTVTLEDTRGGVLGTSNMGGGNAPGIILPTSPAEISGDGILRFTGTLNALRCPAGLSSNNEQLQVQAGRSLTALNPVATLTPANDETYLSVSPLEVDIADIRSAAGFTVEDTGVVHVVLTRTAGDCGGQFGSLVHSPIGDIQLHYFGPSLSDSWEGTVDLGGQQVPIVVNLSQSSTAVSGQYIVLKSVAGPAGSFSATYDGIRMTDILMGVDSLCGLLGGGYTATSLFLTPTSISGTLQGHGCSGNGNADLALTRRNAAVVGGPLSGIWSGTMDVSGGIGIGPVFTRFIQADDHVDGTWGGAGNFGRFSGTLSGSTFSFNGTDDLPSCTLSTSGTMHLVATDSISFTGTGTNCNGSFSANGGVAPGLP